MAEEQKTRIINLAEKSAPDSGDFFAVDSQAGGSKKIPTTALAKAADLTAEAAARTQADNALTSAINSASALIQNPTKTLSGALCSFTDGAEMPVVACTAEIVPKQSGSGTPSPSNVRPISGWESVSVNVMGKNLWSFGSSYTGKSWLVSRSNFELPANAQLTFSFNNDGGGNVTLFGFPSTDGTGRTELGSTSGNKVTFTTAFEVKQISLYISGSATSYTLSDIQLELGTTATDYEPYNGTTTTTSLGRTVYGGTLDVVSGALTADKGIVTFDGSSDETYVAGSYGMAFRTYLPSDFKPTTNNRELAGLVSNQMTEVTQASTWGTVGTCAVIANTTQLYFKLASDLTDISALRTYLASNPLQVCYPLATPQTYTLTGQEVSTLLGQNNIWADSGDIEITYRRDISIVLENLENAING